MPECAVDFVAQTAATGFALVCDGAGNFDGTDATLECIGHYPPLHIFFLALSEQNYRARQTVV
jgi:hypothetical protein